MDRQTLETRLKELEAELEKSINNSQTLKGAVLFAQELLSKWGLGDSDKKEVKTNEPTAKPTTTKK